MSNLERIIEDSLRAVNFASRYVKICNTFPNFDNAKNIKKADIKQILESEKLDFEIAGSENCFFKDYDYDNFKMRFLIEYKNGLFGALMNFVNESATVQLYGGFGTYSTKIDKNFPEKVKYRLPISTNTKMAKDIILKIVALHKDFKAEFSVNWKNYLQQNL